MQDDWQEELNDGVDDENRSCETTSADTSLAVHPGDHVHLIREMHLSPPHPFLRTELTCDIPSL